MPSPGDVDQSVKRAEAVDLRVKGYNYREIGEEMGVGTTTAHDLVRKELDDRSDIMREQIRRERQLDFCRLETMVRKLWAKAFPEGNGGAIEYEAVRSIIRCLERKQKLLGLEAPQKHTVDMGHLNGQVALVVEMITRVIPDESVPKVYEAMEEAMVVIDKRERSLGAEEVA